MERQPDFYQRRIVLINPITSDAHPKQNKVIRRPILGGYRDIPRCGGIPKENPFARKLATISINPIAMRIQFSVVVIVGLRLGGGP